MLFCRADFWSTTVTFLNLSLELFPDSLSSPPDATPPSPLNLWEDRVLAGFCPLKAELSNKDSFSMLDMKKMGREVTNMLYLYSQ